MPLCAHTKIFSNWNFKMNYLYNLLATKHNLDVGSFSVDAAFIHSNTSILGSLGRWISRNEGTHCAL